MKNQKGFIDYSQTIDDVYEHLEDYNLTKKRIMLIVFDDIIADMDSNKKISPKATELFLRRSKINISIVNISQSYLKVPKTISLNTTHYFIMKITSKRELKQIASNDLSDNVVEDFVKLCIDYTKEPYSFLLDYLTLSSDNLLQFKKNLL